jgi:multidrug efflux pump subunit AcrB
MLKLINWLSEQKLLIFLLIFLIFVVGINSLTSLNRQAYPEVNFDMVLITTIYPGGAPDEIENLVTVPIEKKIREVDGIDKVRSYNIENVSVIAIYLEEGGNNDQTVSAIQDAVDAVTDLPAQSETPTVEEIKIDKTPVQYYAIYGKNDSVDYAKIRQTADAFEDFLYSFDGVAEVTENGYLDREFLVEVQPEALIANRIAINNIILTLKNRNLDIPGGPLRVDGKELILRTKGQYENIDEIRNTYILANDQGFGTKISDIGTVTDTFEEPDIYERVNGESAIIMTVWKKKSMDEITLSENINNSFEEFSCPCPEDVEIRMFDDTSEFTRDTISTVVNNAFTGFILLALILFIFLGPRMASIVTVTIPLVFMVAFIFMGIFDVKLNVTSLFGMIMVLGMIVDFGIVVSENAHRYTELGFNKNQAVVKGIAEIALPVTVSFICIAAAFTPLMVLTGMIGKFIFNIPFVIIISLTASWIVALFFMPNLLRIFLPVPKKEEVDAGELPSGEHVEKGFIGSMQRGYMKLIRFSLKFRYITVGIIFILLFLSLSTVVTGCVDFVFIPGGGEEVIEIKTYMPVETSLASNRDEVKKLEKLLLQLPEEEMENIYARVGMESTGGLDPRPGDGTHKSTITIYLTPEKERERIAAEIEKDLRNQIDDAYSAGVFREDFEIVISSMKLGPDVGKPINIEIRGDDFETLEGIAAEYMQYLENIEGVYNITMDLEPGKEELRYTINDEMAARTGISVAQIGNVLNSSYAGASATNVKINGEDINVRVRFDEKYRTQRDSLDDVMISNSRGGLISLTSVTNLKRQPGYSGIYRLNYKRIVQVQAYVDTEVTTSVQVNRELAVQFEDISNKYPGYEVSYGGEQESTNESLSQLGNLFILALLFIYIVLAVFFKSLLIPIVVMIAIPFSLVGVISGVASHGQPLSFMSTLALFSLAGIIVSNTVTLVEFINLKRYDGLNIKDALANAGMLRLRPIILTTGTTVLGLLPTVYSIPIVGGDKNYFVYPLALAFAYGLIFATIITLVLVPCFYHIAEDFKQGLSKLFSIFGLNFDGSLLNK